MLSGTQFEGMQDAPPQPAQAEPSFSEPMPPGVPLSSAELPHVSVHVPASQVLVYPGVSSEPHHPTQTPWAHLPATYSQPQASGGISVHQQSWLPNSVHGARQQQAEQLPHHDHDSAQQQQQQQQQQPDLAQRPTSQQGRMRLDQSHAEPARHQHSVHPPELPSASNNRGPTQPQQVMTRWASLCVHVPHEYSSV